MPSVLLHSTDERYGLLTFKNDIFRMVVKPLSGSVETVIMIVECEHYWVIERIGLLAICSDCTPGHARNREAESWNQFIGGSRHIAMLTFPTGHFERASA
jgi:hypothetical protein